MERRSEGVVRTVNAISEEGGEESRANEGWGRRGRASWRGRRVLKGWICRYVSFFLLRLLRRHFWGCLYKLFGASCKAAPGRYWWVGDDKKS